MFQLFACFVGFITGLESDLFEVDIKVYRRLTDTAGSTIRGYIEKRCIIQELEGDTYRIKGISELAPNLAAN